MWDPDIEKSVLCGDVHAFCSAWKLETDSYEYGCIRLGCMYEHGVSTWTSLMYTYQIDFCC